MKNGNLPAYPDPLRGAEQSISNQEPNREPIGLTKREYFAALNMQAIISSRELMIAIRQDMKADGTNSDNCFAAYAIKQADELLKQLEL